MSALKNKRLRQSRWFMYLHAIQAMAYLSDTLRRRVAIYINAWIMPTGIAKGNSNEWGKRDVKYVCK